MDYPNYTLSYVVMNTEAGANLFHHSCIALSKQLSAQSPIEVIDAYGFYPIAGSSSNLLMKTVKTPLGLGFDLQGSAGELRKESLHSLLRPGLSAKHFSVTVDTFNHVQTQLDNQLFVEQACIAYHREQLTKQKQRVTAHTIFKAELAQAKREGHVPRLKEFRFETPIYLQLFNTNYFTCKSFALSVLFSAGIAKCELKKIYHSKTAGWLPRRSGDGLEPFAMSSEQPIIARMRADGSVSYGRRWPAKRHTVPPEKTTLADCYWVRSAMQPIAANGQPLAPLIPLSAPQQQRLNNSILGLQRLEQRLLKAYRYPMALACREQHIESIHEHYRCIATLGNAPSANAIVQLIDDISATLLSIEQTIDNRCDQALARATMLLFIANLSGMVGMMAVFSLIIAAHAALALPTAIAGGSLCLASRLGAHGFFHQAKGLQPPLPSTEAKVKEATLAFV